MPISVLLADDATIIRDAIRALLDSQPEVMVVGEASDFAETIRLMEKLKPNVIVMDLHMPDESKVRPTDVKAQLGKGTSLLLAISIWNDAESIALADSFGASRLLKKEDLAKTLMSAILDLLHTYPSRSATA
jgi:DNA-binding NarL/FixJ family response regulator